MLYYLFNHSGPPFTPTDIWLYPGYRSGPLRGVATGTPLGYGPGGDRRRLQETSTSFIPTDWASGWSARPASGGSWVRAPGEVKIIPEAAEKTCACSFRLEPLCHNPWVLAPAAQQLGLRPVPIYTLPLIYIKGCAWDPLKMCTCCCEDRI